MELSPTSQQPPFIFQESHLRILQPIVSFPQAIRLHQQFQISTIAMSQFQCTVMRQDVDIRPCQDSSPNDWRPDDDTRRPPSPGQSQPDLSDRRIQHQRRNITVGPPQPEKPPLNHRQYREPQWQQPLRPYFGWQRRILGNDAGLPITRQKELTSMIVGFSISDGITRLHNHGLVFSVQTKRSSIRRMNSSNMGELNTMISSPDPDQDRLERFLMQ